MPNPDLSALSYQEQLDTKLRIFTEKLSALSNAPIEVFQSPETGYRMRAEFRIWHDDMDTHYAMHKPGTKEIYYLENFPVASEKIQQLMPELIKQIREIEVLRLRLFSVEFLSTQTGEILVTLIYHKPLDDDWKSQAIQLKNSLGIHLIGRSKKQKIVLDQDYVIEELVVRDRRYRYQQFENSFTQPNAMVNEQMISWACQQAERLQPKRVEADKQQGDLLELYCGNGNFTLPLAQFFDKVLTTEISKSSIAALKWNLDENDIGNVDHARLSAEEITQAIDRVRPFRRLSHLDLDAYHFSTIFVDPPRAGIDELTLKLMARFDNIIYISCNPDTLFQNLDQLKNSHRIEAAAVFDQFPFTPHLESGVWLKKSGQT